MEELRPNDRRINKSIILLWVVLALECINVILYCTEYYFLKDHEYEYMADDNIILFLVYIAQIIFGFIYFVAYAFSGVLFIMWFRRAYYNLHNLNANLSYNEGWAAGGWFVPFLNLFRPYIIMKEIYNETDRLLTKNNVENYQKLSNVLLPVWWAIWVIVNIIANIAVRMTFRAETIEDQLSALILHIISSILNMPLALITINIVKNYANAQPLLNSVAPDNEDEEIDYSLI